MGYFYPLLLFAIGLATFYSVLFKGFILDDKTQIVNNPTVHTISTIPAYFITSLHYETTTSLLSGYTFRPMTYTAYTLLYAVGHGSAFPFHLFLLLLYITNALLVYFLFLKFIKPQGAFLAALVFLIHPANLEIAAYIADIQDGLYFLFGVIALLVVMSKRSLRKRVITTCALLFASLLSKETGLLFSVAVGIYISLFERKHMKHFLIGIGIMLTCYLALRIFAGQSPFLTVIVPHTSVVQHTHWLAHILLVPKMLSYYLSTIIMPLPALPLAYLASTNVVSSLVALFIAVCVYGGAIWIALQLKQRPDKHAFKAFTFFLSLFLISTLFHSQLIPLDVLVSKRWLYVQVLAAIGMLSVLLQLFYSHTKRYKPFLVVLYIVYLMILFVETTIALRYY